jgi:hypothetical protein
LLYQDVVLNYFDDVLMNVEIYQFEKQHLTLVYNQVF